MTAAPRLFRSLEKRHLDGFDAIVDAAAANYGSLRYPSFRQAAQFGELVAPVWDSLSAATRRNVAESLAAMRVVPRSVTEKLLASSAEIAGPFLCASPLLTEEDVEILSLSPDPELRRIADLRRPDFLLHPEPEQPAKPGDGAPAAVAPVGAALGPSDTAAMDLDVAGGELAERLREIEPPPLAPELVDPAADAPAPTPAKPSAAGVREALRRLAQPGGRQAVLDERAADIRQLRQLAADGNTERFYRRLADLFSLSDERLAKLVADPAGEDLAVAMKALNFGATDALTIMMMVKPQIGLDIAQFDRTKRLYRALRCEECRELLREAAEPARRVKRHQPQALGLDRPQAASFGRRATRPSTSPASTTRRTTG
ncbi:hypothetical protein [Mangrovibrevibacter kandeliae]|uniref:hypothetical protein n=1 Tax=Mangrovibrevibacter kandeliae TaxID=2968473 RepID=UPI00211777C9|nr:hypothetical protein [Aurantimonas sp. CSK15Z-1]MCQ8781067.1 hypothetical protein [Aurantimonas sp. CSK15Z-1]